MKKKNVLAIIFASLLISAAALMSSCKSDDLEAKIDANAGEVESSVTEINGAITDLKDKTAAEIKSASDKASADIEAAKTALNQAISDGDKTNADEITAKVTELTTAINNAQKTLSDADAALTATVESNKTEAAASIASTKDELTNAIAAAKTDLQTAIDKVAKDAADNLEAAKKDLNEAIDKKADQTVLDEKVTELDKAIKAVETIANAAQTAKQVTDAVEAAKTELNTAITSVKEDLQKNIDTLKADLDATTEKLNKYMTSNDASVKDLQDAKAKLDKEVTSIKESITALETSLKNYATTESLTNINTALTNKINALEAALNNAILASDAASVKIELWNKATDKVVEAVIEINKYYNNINWDSYYSEQQDIIDNIQLEFQIKLLRATEENAVEDILRAKDGYYASMKAVITKSDVIYNVLTEHGEKIESVLYNDKWDEAITNALEMIAEEPAGAIKADVIELANKMKDRYDFLAGQNTAAEAINARINALIVELQNKGYRAATKAEYEAIIKAIAEWDEETGSANKDLINRSLVEKLSFEYEMAIQRYVAITRDIQSKLDKFNGEYVYIHSDKEYKAVCDAYEAYNKWVTMVKGVGFSIFGETEMPTYESFGIFYFGTYQKANAIKALEADIAALMTRVENVTYDINMNGYTAANKAEYEAIMTALNTIKTTIGEVNYSMIDTEAVESMTFSYESSIVEYKIVSDYVLNTINAFNGDYEYIYNVDVEAIYDAYGIYSEWLNMIQGRGFTTTSSDVEKAIATAYETFKNGTYARMKALDDAKVLADMINSSVSSLSNKINELTVVKSQYKADLATIDRSVENWINMYFTDYAKEGVNYNLVDHEAIAKLHADYDRVIAVILEKAEKLAECIAKLDTITVMSGNDIDAARVQYLSFTDHLGDLQYEIDSLGTPSEITALFTSKAAEFKKLCEEAATAYNALTILNKNNVTIHNKAEVDAMIAWYAKYPKVDITKADSTLGVESVKLTETFTLKATDVDAAKACVAAYNELIAAKKQEKIDVEKLVADLVAKNASTALRSEIDKVLAAVETYVDGTGAPAGYDKAQFATANDIAKYDELTALNTAVTALEGRRDALYAEILSYKDFKATDLVDDTVRAEFADKIADLEARIEEFTTDNDGVDCFKGQYSDIISTANTNIEKGAAISAIKVDYDALITANNGIADERVKNDIAKRAKAAYDNAVEAVIAENNDAVALNKAKLELVAYTVTEYQAVVTAENSKVVYEAYTLLSDRREMTKADQLADEKIFVHETFNAVNQ